MTNFKSLQMRHKHTNILYGINQVGYGTAVVNGRTRDNNVIAMAQAMGCTALRIAWDWSALQPTNTTPFWSGPDGVVAAAGLANIKLTFCIFNSPGWANGGLSSIGIPTYQGPNDASWQAAYATYCGLFATRYAGNGIIYELMNEQNTNGFWRENDDPSITPKYQQYMSLYTPAAAAIKAADPSAKVIMGGLAALNFWSGAGASTGRTYLGNLMSNGFVTDMISIHPYQLTVAQSHNPSVDVSPNGNSWVDVGRVQSDMVGGGKDANGKPYKRYQLHLGEFGFWSAADVGSEATKATYITKVFTDVHNTYGLGAVGPEGAPVVWATYFALNNGTNGTTDTDDKGLWTGTPLVGPNTILASGTALQSFMASLY